MPKTEKPLKISSNWKTLVKQINYKKKKVTSATAGSQESLVNEATAKELSKSAAQKFNGDKVGKYLGIDCEMVGVGPGGLTSALARCSIVNFHGKVIYDEYCIPMEPIKDYRTSVSGITPSILKSRGKSYKELQQEVADIIKDKILVGHALKNDLQVLMLQHPAKLIRDTARYKPLKNQETSNPQSLKNLAKIHLNKSIQGDAHSSVEDASAQWKFTRYTRKTGISQFLKERKLS